MLARALSLDPGAASTRGTWLAREFARWKGRSMLRIYPVVLEVLRQLQPVLRQIERRDRDLARQLRRCSASVALNLAEGMFSRGQNRGVRYHSALGSARETLACLEVALACGYIQQLGLPEEALLRVIGTLIKLVR